MEDSKTTNETPTPPNTSESKPSEKKYPNSMTEAQWAEIDRRTAPAWEKFRSDLRRMFGGDFSVLDEPSNYKDLILPK